MQSEVIDRERQKERKYSKERTVGKRNERTKGIYEKGEGAVERDTMGGRKKEEENG